jgi:hypothetical protein
MDSDGWKSVRPWPKEKMVNYTIVIGNSKQYGLDGMPLTVLIDRDGKIADVHSGIVSRPATDQKLCILLFHSHSLICAWLMIPLPSRSVGPPLAHTSPLAR